VLLVLKLGHKSADYSRRQAGQPKLPRPGSTITGAPGGGGNNNNSDGGGKNSCTRCKGQHYTKNCYHEPANASKRPKGWIVGGTKEEFGTVSIDADDGVHKPDFFIIAVEHDCSINSSAIDLTKELVPDSSHVAIDSLAVPKPRSAIDAQLLLIQDRVDPIVHKPDFLIIAIEHDCLINSNIINSTIAKELVPDFSLVAIDSLTNPEARSAIDAQLLLIQDGVNRIPVMAPILAPILGVHFFQGHIFLKNGTF
jgi:hypothetical protein